jgi:hypothetical protein
MFIFSLIMMQLFLWNPLASCFVVFYQLVWEPPRATFLLHKVWVRALKTDVVDTFASCAIFWHFVSIVFQQTVDRNHQCVIQCCQQPATSCIISNSCLTFKEARCPPQNCAMIHCTIPTNFKLCHVMALCGKWPTFIWCSLVSFLTFPHHNLPFHTTCSCLRKSLVVPSLNWQVASKIVLDLEC